MLSIDCHAEIHISLNWLLHGIMMCDCDDVLGLGFFSVSICSGLYFLYLQLNCIMNNEAQYKVIHKSIVLYPKLLFYESLKHAFTELPGKASIIKHLA